MENPSNKEILKGMKVEILTKARKNVTGIVEDIGSLNTSHSEVMVRLKTGEIGRVKSIVHEIGKTKTESESLIQKGENFKLEFKSDALWSLNHKNQDIDKTNSYDLRTYRQKASKVIIARSIAALLNSEGGNLLIGVKEKKDGKNEFEITGIQPDLEKLKTLEKDFSNDGYKRMIIDDIIRPFFPQKIYNMLNNYISINFEQVNDKTICNIKVKPSNSKVFLNLEGRKIFLIRTETETRQIVDEELVDYCMKRFLS